MVKINREEYEKIKSLPDYDWNWIVREKTGKILSFTNKPTKTDEVWKDNQTRLWFNYKDSQLFQFIKWEDSEPYNIQELIAEYEDEEYGYFNMKLSREYEQFIEESEETEVKMDKRELKGTLIAAAWEENEGVYHVRLEDVFEIIDQLDEPEDCTEALLDLGQTLIRVQSERDEAEKELRELKDIQPVEVVVPDFVFNHIKMHKDKDLPLWVAMRDGAEYELKPWMTGTNQDLYARAWLAYPNIEVEKEKKYEVKDKNDCFLLTKNSEGEVINAYSKVVYKNKGQLTEQEIKDYDERYWPFAEEVK